MFDRSYQVQTEITRTMSCTTHNDSGHVHPSDYY